MKIFVLNRGSSNIKCSLYEFKDLPEVPVEPIWQAQGNNEDLTKIIKTVSKQDIDVIGHRIVHGGKFFQGSVIIDQKVKEKIGSLAELAPLHNFSELESIETLEKIFPNIPQIAIFDTVFHQTLQNASKIYPGPYKWFEEGIQRYGFHGISFQYCSKRAAQILNKELNSLKMVVCHLGSGASLCAIQDSKSIDTTMGFTPLEGLMMNTRSGTIDPGIILYLLEKKQLTAQEIAKQLYEDSGLLGISGNNVFIDIIEKSQQGDVRSTLALEIYLHRLNSLIGSMIASLQGIDALVFTAGIGENVPWIREKVCECFSFLGMKIDRSKNASPGSEDCLISDPYSKIKVLLIHTKEAFEIAKECWKLLH